HRRPAPLLGDVVAKLDGSSLESSLARRLRPFVAGSYRGLFDRATTVRPEGHLVVLSLRDLPDEPQELRAAGTLAALDAIWRRVRSAECKPRIVVVDEAWLLLGEASAARFLARLAKSARKHWCGLVTVTQDVSDVLSSDLGQTVLANSATRVLLRQSPHTIAELSKAFALSDGEGSYLQTCRQGRGLYCAGTERASLEVVASLEEHALITDDPEFLASLEASSKNSGVDQQ
ncbi:MAG: VirB4 family type IV secretion system protein, partial [Candidatus Limnocylindria bacterium]